MHLKDIAKIGLNRWVGNAMLDTFLKVAKHPALRSALMILGIKVAPSFSGANCLPPSLA